MSYSEILKLVNKLKLEKGEKCLICHLPISKKQNKIKLNCSHLYHTKCILNYSKIKKTIKCQYCSQITKNKICKICGKYYIGEKCCNNKFDSKCTAIFKYGKNKGKICGKVNCKRHKQINNNICKNIIKSGPKKGQICNRINCKYHKIKIITI